MKTTIKTVICATMVACSLSSCSDYLELLPMDQVVLENYWTEKADVTSVLYGCYESLGSKDVLNRIGVWGELRSDNVTQGRGNTPNEIRELLEENLIPTNIYCNWASLYGVINRCNTVCYYAPQVQKIDPNYSLTDMKANIAEATAIRALCYFTLARTFRDVPYTTQPSIDDDQEYVLPAMPFDQLLDSLIVDLEGVKNDAVRRYGKEEARNSVSPIYVPDQNAGRITRWAVCALLADICLWKGDWDKCIDNCNEVLAYKRQVYDELSQEEQLKTIEFFEGIPMIVESTAKGTPVGGAYNQNFGDGNSYESIFELNYLSTSGTPKNEYVASFYGNASNNGYLKSSDFIKDEIGTSSNPIFKTYYDCRAYESMNVNDEYSIAKYVIADVSFTQSQTTLPKPTYVYRGADNAHWSFYRLTDIMLMKAEALIERDNTSFSNAFRLITAVNKRALHCTENEKKADTLIFSPTASKAEMEDLLLLERQREFMFEGKRWFDLVRTARRDGNTSRITPLITRKYKSKRNIVKVKMADPNYIYFPYLRGELKVNPLLHQNPAYSNTEDSEMK